MDRGGADRRIERVSVCAPHRAFFSTGATAELDGLPDFEADHSRGGVPHYRGCLFGGAHDGVGVRSLENKALLPRTICVGSHSISFAGAVDGPAGAQFDRYCTALLKSYHTTMDGGGADRRVRGIDITSPNRVRLASGGTGEGQRLSF